MNYSSELNSKITRYYTRYYYDELGINKYEQLILNRLNEEVSILDDIHKAEKLTGVKFGPGKKVFVGGAGTGGEIIVFQKMGCEALGVEPNPDAVEITKEKLAHNNLPHDRIILGRLEDLNIESNSFDFVYCWTVLEHVQDVQKSLHSLIRICKPGGTIFIGTPDYRFMYEGHYKLPLPMFLPKFLIKLILLLIGRPTSFLDSIQFVTAKKVRSILKRSTVIALQANFPYAPEIIHNNGFLARVNRFYSDYLEIQKDQVWVIRKL